MADENSFFIQVLSDHLNERKTIPPETIDWSIVLKLGIIHQVEGMVIDKGIRFSDLKGTLEGFAKKLFGEETRVKFKASERACSK